MSGYLLAELRLRLGRALGALVGVALGMALYVGLTAVADGFAEAAKQPLAGIGADILISRLEGNATTQTTRGVRQPFGLAPLTVNDAADLGTIDGVGGVSGGLLLWDFGAASYQTLLGIEAEMGVGPAKVSEWVVNGRFFQSNEHKVVVVDRHFAAFFNLQPGMTHEIGGQNFTVVGVVEVPGGNQAAAANFYLPLADAQALAGLPTDQINQIYLRVAEASELEAVVAASEAKVGDISALTEQSIVQVMGGMAQISDRFSGVTAMAALLSGLILTGATLSANINLRTVEIGVMKAIGWQAQDVVRLFVAEGVALSLLGAALGILLGWLATLILSQIPVDLNLLAGTTPDLGSGPEIAAYTLPARLSWNAVGIATAVTLIGGSLISYLFARHAANLKPAEALRNQ